MNFTKQLLSESTNGKQIKITTTATPGTLIHTAVSGTTDYDEIYIYATSASTSSQKLTIEWGEVTEPDGNIEITIQPEQGYALIIPGLILQNSLVVNAFAETGTVILINGYVNRITG